MKKFILLFIILFSAGIIFKNDIAALVSGNTASENEKTDQEQPEKASNKISIKQQWDLPDILLEISGLAHIDAERFACIQDELGTLYIYNIKTSSIEKEIEFTGSGDFEGIALIGNIAYIVRSDGLIFEVDINTGKSGKHPTFLTATDNIETLFYDNSKNRLLLAGKEPDQTNPATKNIYAFDIFSKTLNKTPVVTIDLSDEVFSNTERSSKKKKAFMPSDLAIHPATRDMYILDGPQSRLLVTNPTGSIKNLYNLGKEFYKPEGISFSPAGDLFISNEGKKNPGNIMQVVIGE